LYKYGNGQFGEETCFDRKQGHIVETLLDKGGFLGTELAFMMSVIALSLQDHLST